MVNVEKLSENRVKLTVSVTAEQFEVALDEAFKKVVKDVKVDGFRPGKLPKSMFIKRFGYEALYQDAVEIAFQMTYMVALQEAKVYATSDPKVELVEGTEIEHGKGFEYTAEVDVWPEVHLGEYKGLKVKKASSRVLKKDVEEYIEKELAKKAEWTVKEGAAEKGDTVVIDYVGSVDGVEFEGGKGENYSLELGSNSFIPGFEDQLVGAAAGADVSVSVTFPTEYHAAELAGKAAVFACHVHEVKYKVTPELNDEFVAELELEGVKTVEEYNNYVKGLLKDQKEKEAEAKFEEDCIKACCDASYAEFPDSLIENSVQREVARLEEQAKQYNIPADLLLQYYGMGNMEAYKAQVSENIRVQYLQELVFDKIIELENITATTEEIEAEYTKAAGGDTEKVAELKKQYPAERVAYSVKVRKAIDLVKANVSK